MGELGEKVEGVAQQPDNIAFIEIGVGTQLWPFHTQSPLLHQSNQINKVLKFAEFLQRLSSPGTLTELRDIAKRSGPAPSDRELQTEYTDYLTQKYQ